MSLCLSPSPSLFQPSVHRKRTSPFSIPTQSPLSRPTKAPRISHNTMRRTNSFVNVTEAFVTPSLAPSSSSERPQPIHRPRLAQPVDSDVVMSSSVRDQESESCDDSRHSSIIMPDEPTFTLSRTSSHHSDNLRCTTLRTSSPLSPRRSVLPGRPVFPRSKTEPDLHRRAVTSCMMQTPEGQRMLHMGPRLAFSIATATRELERIVAAAQLEKEVDVPLDVPMDINMDTSTLSNSWVVVPGEDWEMVSCAG